MIICHFDCITMHLHCAVQNKQIKAILLVNNFLLTVVSLLLGETKRLLKLSSHIQAVIQEQAFEYE